MWLSGTLSNESSLNSFREGAEKRLPLGRTFADVSCMRLFGCGSNHKERCRLIWSLDLELGLDTEISRSETSL